MSEASHLSIILQEVIDQVAPGVLTELRGWKHCDYCHGLSTWATADYDPTLDLLICPHCGVYIVEDDPQPLRSAESCPGVERAEPSGGEAAQ